MRSRFTRLTTFCAALLIGLSSPIAAGAQSPAGHGSTVTAVDPNCTGYGTEALVDPTSAAYIRNLKTNAVIGSVQLCERQVENGSWRVWAWVTLYSDIWTGQHANGRLVGTQAGWADEIRTCSDWGGTGPIMGGIHDRTCATAGIGSNIYWYHRAEAYVYDGNEIIGSGATTKYRGHVE